MSALTLFARYSDELKAWLSTPVSLDSGSSGGSGGTVSIEAWHGCSSGQLGLSLGGYPVTITPPSDTADGSYFMVDTNASSVAIQNVVADTVEWIFSQDPFATTLPQVLNRLRSLAARRLAAPSPNAGGNNSSSSTTNSSNSGGSSSSSSSSSDAGGTRPRADSQSSTENMGSGEEGSDAGSDQEDEDEDDSRHNASSDEDYAYEDDDDGIDDDNGGGSSGGGGGALVNQEWYQEHQMKRRWAVKEAELRAALATAQLERESTTNDNQKRRGSQGKASSSNEATGAGASAGAGAATGDSVDHSSSDSSDSTTTADTNATGTTTAAATTNTTSSKSPLPTAADGRLMGHSSSRLGHLEAPTNIFSGAASSQVLTADLLNLIRQQDALGLKCSAVDDNIYCWQVLLEVDGFYEGGLGNGMLAADLDHLEELYGYAHVELEISFAMDLYPFFPPEVKVVRPRFHGFVLGQIAQMDCLQLTHWSSVGTMAAAIGAIKKLLALHARIDFSTERNDPQAYPEGAYNQLEHHLMRFGLLTELAPRVSIKAAAKEEEKLQATALAAAAAAAADTAAADTAAADTAATAADASAADSHQMAEEPLRSPATKSGDTTTTKRKLSPSLPGHNTSSSVSSSSSSSTSSSGTVSGSSSSSQNASNDGGNNNDNSKEGQPSKRRSPPPSNDNGGDNVATSQVSTSTATASGSSGVGSAASMHAKVPGQGVLTAPAPGTTAASTTSSSSVSTTATASSIAAATGAAATATTVSTAAAEGSVPPLQSSASGSVGSGLKARAPQGEKTYWAKGTGYGHSGAPSKAWDVEAWRTAQREKDRLIESLLLLVLQELDPRTRTHRNDHDNTPDRAATTATSATASNSSSAAAPSSDSQDSSLPDGKFKAKPTSTETEASKDIEGLADPFEVVNIPGVAALYLRKPPVRSAPAGASSKASSAGNTVSLSMETSTSVKPSISEEANTEVALGLGNNDIAMAPEEVHALEESCLVPFLEGLLANESLLDMERHSPLYVTTFQVLRCLLRGGAAAQQLLLPLPNQKPGSALLQLLLKHRKGLGVFLKTNGYISAISAISANSANPATATATATAAASSAPAGASAKSSATGSPPKTAKSNNDTCPTSWSKEGTTSFSLLKPGHSSSSTNRNGLASSAAGDGENDRLMVTLAVTLYECFEAFGGEASVRDLLSKPHPDEIHAAASFASSSSSSISTLGAQSGIASGTTAPSVVSTNGKSGDASTTSLEIGNGSANATFGAKGSGAAADGASRVGNSKEKNLAPATGGGAADGGAAAAAADGDDDEAYVAALSELSYDESDKLGGFHFQAAADLAAKQGSNPRRLKRLAQEHADLSSSLPCTPSSSVWCRPHAERMDCMQFAISGPEDTPYSGGLFIFDTFFPSDYPSSGPKVNLQTTGQGSVRFNPNLYNCGKVCLSLLGTWRGESSENWDPNCSTLLQVMVSIQSLIMVPQPYFNEPGYERDIGTPKGDAASKNYNAHIRNMTVKWAMIDMLKRPPAGFEEVVRLHFKHRSAFLRQQCAAWVADATPQLSTTSGASISSSSSGSSSSSMFGSRYGGGSAQLAHLVAELNALLDAL